MVSVKVGQSGQQSRENCVLELSISRKKGSIVAQKIAFQIIFIPLILVIYQCKTIHYVFVFVYSPISQKILYKIVCSFKQVKPCITMSLLSKTNHILLSIFKSLIFSCLLKQIISCVLSLLSTSVSLRREIYFSRGSHVMCHVIFLNIRLI